MKTGTKAAVATVAFALPATLLGRVIRPPAEGAHEPTAGQIPFFVGLSAVEALAFGAVRRAAGSRARAWAAYLSLGWLLASWWPHDNLHVRNGDDLQGLPYIEYGFHATLMAAGVVLAYPFLTAPLSRAGSHPAVAAPAE